MTDIFFSYSSADRERVRPIRDTLAAQGFEVFWDQQVPPGMDWDTWIRQHLTKSKCAMAFWSATSVSSDNVRHEAMVAKQQGKLISVLLEPLTVDQFPMGLYAQQAANLSGWNGDFGHDEWRKFRREFEAKLTPLWVRRQIDEIEAELVGERARRGGAERRDKVLQAQIAKEAEIQQDLKQERDKALDEVAALNATVEKLTRVGAEAATRELEAERRDRALQAQIAKEAEAFQDLKRERDKTLDEVMALKATVGDLTQARAGAKTKLAEAQQAFKRERDSALDEVAALKATVEEMTQAREHAEANAVELSQRLKKIRQSKAQETVRSIGAAFSPFVIAVAVATLGFWTYQLIWSAPHSLSALTSETAQETEQRLAAMKEEAQSQAKAVADAEAKLKAAEAEQQRLKEEVERQTKGAADLETKLKAAEAEQQRLRDEVQRLAKAAPAALPQSTSTASFERRSDMRALGNVVADGALVNSVGECEQKCTSLSACTAFSFDKSIKKCYFYKGAVLISDAKYDSGTRAPAAVGGATEFERRSFTYIQGSVINSGVVSSLEECERKCALLAECKGFSLYRDYKTCSLYSRASFAPSGNFDSGIRK
jgi:hypothetical protein